MSRRQIRLLPVLDTDPPGYNAVVSGRVAADDVAGSGVLSDRLTETERALEAFLEITGGRGVVNVHTSPFFRSTFLTEPFLSLWHKASSGGCDIALHAHEDRPGGRTWFHDRAHVARVVAECSAKLRKAGLTVRAFRSGYCAFSTHLVPILEANGLDVDLSAAPGIVNHERDVDWLGGPTTAQWLDARDYRAVPPREPSRVLTVPIGWDGWPGGYAGHYLFNEVNRVADLARVYHEICRRAEREGRSQTVLFLCHTYGLCDAAWRAQAGRFLSTVRDDLVGVEAVRTAVGKDG
jgi:hypothetical protein